MIKYVKGDATYPEKNTPNKFNLIVHVVNDIGAWGKGFVLALSKRWTSPEYHYKRVWKAKSLGDIDIVRVAENISVVNIFGQHGIKKSHPKKVIFPQPRINVESEQPVRYDSIRKGLSSLRKLIGSEINKYVIHMPKIGCGLAGGDWSVVSRIVDEVLSDIDVYVYEL